MKKSRLFNLNYRALNYGQIFLKMKIIAVLLILAINSSASVFSQVRLSVTFNKTPLRSALKVIEQQTDYRFVYSNDVVPFKEEVTLKAQNEDLSVVLSKVLSNMNVNYRIMDNKIIALSEKVNSSVPEVKNAEVLTSYGGKVIDKTNLPLGGATVKLISDREYSASTNTDGIFIFSNIPVGVYTIKIAYVGYEVYEAKVTVMNYNNQQVFVLNAVENSLQEVVVVGYGETKRRDLVGSVARITAKDIAKQPVNNLLSSLQGMAPGLEITNTSGTPGAAVNVRIRGINSVNGGSPLILVDNVPGDLASIAPSDVESVEILKDASSTAIYGARGSNGVILVTTKRGRTSKGQLTVSAYSSITNPTKLSPVLNTDQYLELRKEGYKNDNIPYNAVSAPDLFMDNSVNTNWAKQLYKPALAQDYQINFSGGSNETNYFFSSGLRNEDATVKGDWSNGRYNIRTGIDTKLFKNLTVGGGLAYTYTKNYSYDAAIAPAIYYALPVIPYEGADGQPNLNTYSTYTNPNRLLTSYNSSKSSQLLGNIYMDYNIWDKLSFRTDVSFNSTSGKSMAFQPTTSSVMDFGSNFGSYGFNDGTTVNIEPKLNYEKDFGSHHIKLLAGATYMNNSGSNTTLATYTPTNAIDDLNTIAAGDVSYRVYTEEPYKFASVFGRVNYKFKDRYLLEGVLRRDGSSRFGPDNKYGTFWSVGGGYILTDEPFIKDLVGKDIFAKLRASYGTTGTDAIGAFRYVATSPVTSYGYMGNTTISVGNLANPSLRWEETKKFDVGLDVNILNNRIGFTADYYRSRTNGMLYNNYLSYVTGFNSITTNMPGLVDNNGLELSLNFVPVSNDQFKWTSTFNISFIKNKLVSLPALANATYGNKYIYQVGSPLDLVWGFKYQGVDPKTGLAKFEDVDKNGGISIYSPDYQVIGKGIPDYFGGWNNVFSYKRFDFTVFSQFVKGITKGYNVFSGIGDVYNQPVSVMDRWQKEGDITDIPRAAAPGTAAADNNNKINQSDFAYSDASYFRIKNITLGYNVPTKHLGINALRVYATGYNLFTITGFKGDDPEGSSNVVPMIKMYTVGLNLTF
jgi:TonB-linked SusC/RagA family outer membrane protein